MDTPFRTQDQAASEMRSISQRIETLQASLRQRDLHISSITAEKDSFKLKALFDCNDQLDVMCNNFGVMFVEANCWVKKQHLARDGRHLNRRGSHQLGTLFSEVFSVAFGLKKGYDTVGVIPGLEENASKEPILPEEVPSSPSDITQGEHFLEVLSQMTLPL
ncbi:hypothetical protein J6590_086558 [Homalodisca vitripennis]|nr:hypothetical protein J6590_086558 [Homalodisca vitripennis]